MSVFDFPFLLRKPDFAADCALFKMQFSGLVLQIYDEILIFPKVFIYFSENNFKFLKIVSKYL